MRVVPVSLGWVVRLGLVAGGGFGGRTGNGTDGVGLGLTVADGVSVSRELPEALGGVDVGVGDLAGVLGVVDEAEVVGPSGVVLQGHGEEGRVELRLDGIEEGGLRLGLDGVDRAECQTQQTVVVLVLGELRTDGAGGFHGLRVGCHVTHCHGVLVDIAAGGAAVAVRDIPRGSAQLGGAGGGFVYTMARLFGSG